MRLLPHLAVMSCVAVSLSLVARGDGGAAPDVLTEAG